MIARASIQSLPLAANSIDMIFTDPPYVKPLLHTYQWLANEAARVLRPGSFIAAMCGSTNLNQIMRWFDDAGLTYYWLYQLFMSGANTGIAWRRHEGESKPIVTRTKHVIVYSKGPAVSRTVTSGTYTPGANDKRWHHWGQSVDSHRYYIDCFSKPDDLILDPFCGGGTTGVACAILDRRFLLFDIDPTALTTTQRRLKGESPETAPLPLFHPYPVAHAGQFLTHHRHPPAQTCAGHSVAQGVYP